MPIGAGMLGVWCGQRDRRVSKESYGGRAASSQAGKGHPGSSDCSSYSSSWVAGAKCLVPALLSPGDPGFGCGKGLGCKRVRAGLLDLPLGIATSHCFPCNEHAASREEAFFLSALKGFHFQGE